MLNTGMAKTPNRRPPSPAAPVAKRKRGRPPSPNGPKSQAEIQRAYRARLAAANRRWEMAADSAGLGVFDLDTRSGLVMIYALMNLPIVVWMLFTFYKEVPNEILEAGRMDGAKTGGEVWYLLLPLTMPGVASTGLLSLILCWNEAFWSLNLTSSGAAPLTAFIAQFSSPQGLFFAKLSAASTIAIAPILVFGWLSQRQLVRGLTFGAVK